MKTKGKKRIFGRIAKAQNDKPGVAGRKKKSFKPWKRAAFDPDSWSNPVKTLDDLGTWRTFDTRRENPFIYPPTSGAMDDELNVLDWIDQSACDKKVSSETV